MLDICLTQLLGVICNNVFCMTLIISGVMVISAVNRLYS